MSKEGSLDNIYRNYFQNITGVNRIERIGDMEKQRIGLDTYVTLKSGESIRVQEKWRNRRFTNDFLVEYCSVFKDGFCQAPGWIYSCDADYIFAVYAFSDLVKIYPVVQLKIAWVNNQEEWIKDFRLPPARTKDRSGNIKYQTLNAAVPCPVLEKEIMRVMRFDYQQVLPGMHA